MLKTTVQPGDKVATLTNQEFYAKCVRLGSTAKAAVREFLALLPEAEDRQVYLEHNMSSIFEFAAKLGGVSREQVQRVLQLHERFKDIPLFKQALLTGDISLAKLARVASVVTPKNQTFWLTQTKLLSKPALEILIKDARPEEHSVPGHSVNPNKTTKSASTKAKIEKVPQADELNLTPVVKERLLALQNKGLDLNQILNELLDQREESIQEEKQRIGSELDETKPTKASRYIPVKVKKILEKEFGTKCAHSNCVNRVMDTHHQTRFAADPRHNPLYMVPVCKQHHEISHTIDLKVNEERSKHLE